jgi:hypothetical protein
VAKKERREAQKAAKKERQEAQKWGREAQKAAKKERQEAQKWAAAGTSTARAAAGIEHDGLPWRPTHLPYLAGGSPHWRIERRPGVDPQGAARSRSERGRIKPPRQRGWTPPLGGRAREVVGASPCSGRGQILLPSLE